MSTMGPETSFRCFWSNHLRNFRSANIAASDLAEGFRDFGPLLCVSPSKNGYQVCCVEELDL